jgi:predicted metal-binding membrane protein
MTVLRHDTLARPRPSLANIATSVAMAGLVGAAWFWTVGQAQRMSMVAGVAQVGRAMPFDMSGAAFLGMWATMMVAMMLPSVAPLVLACSSWRPPLAATSSRIVFVAGYLAIWTATGVLALVALRALGGVGHASAWIDRAGGAVLVVAGAYQLTRSKQVSLRVYQEALHAPATYAADGGPVAAARAGLHHGRCCLAGCGALMAVLLVVGVMNLGGMAAITVICFAEKNGRHGAAIARWVGLGLLGLGLAVLVHPPFLTV